MPRPLSQQAPPAPLRPLGFSLESALASSKINTLTTWLAQAVGRGRASCRGQRPPSSACCACTPHPGLVLARLGVSMWVGLGCCGGGEFGGNGAGSGLGLVGDHLEAQAGCHHSGQGQSRGGHPSSLLLIPQPPPLGGARNSSLAGVGGGPASLQRAGCPRTVWQPPPEG